MGRREWFQYSGLKVKVLGDLEEQILGFICGGEQKCGECA